MLVAWLLSIIAQGAVVDRVAAVVNDEVIALSDLYELGGEFVERKCPALDAPCVLDAELEILDVEVRRVLVRQELDRLKLQITAADVDRAIDDTVRQYPEIGDRDALRAEVEGSGQNWGQYREELFEFLRTQTFQGRILAPRVTINDDEIRDRYQRESRKLSTKVALVEGFGLPVPDNADEAAVLALVSKAKGLVDKINAGSLPWQDALAKHDGADVSEMFGREFAPGELIADLDRVIVGAEVGVAQAPVAMGNILFVLSVRSTGERAVELSFDDARDQIRNVIFQEKLAQAEEEWYQRARREAAIVVKLK